MSENVFDLDRDVNDKGRFRRFIVEMEQGIVKLVCDGVEIPYKIINDIEEKKKDALLSAMMDVTVDMFGEKDIVKDKAELITELKASADEFERVTNPVIEEEPVE